MQMADILGAPHAYDWFPLAAPTSRADDYAEGAHAETVVFVHGWLLSRAYWQPLVSQLQTYYGCLTYDMRGFGDSVQGKVSADKLALRYVHLPPGKTWYPVEQAAPYTVSLYSLAAYAQDLGALLDHLGLHRVWLMGHSLGGSVALWAAYLFPERIKGVICLNAGGGIYIPKEFEKFRAAGQQMVKFRPAWLPKLPLLPRIFSQAMVFQNLDLRWGQQRLRDFVRADSAAAEGALLESTTCEEVRYLPKLVGQLTQPVHFITASQDTIMLPRYVRYLASFHPRCHQETLVSEIAYCGHMAMVEQPQAVGALVRQVLVDYAY